MKQYFYIFALAFALSVQNPCWAEQKIPAYFVEQNALNENSKNRYLDIRDSLDNLSGGERALEDIRIKIEQFIKEEPLFLPIYVEQARYTIILGYTGIKDAEMYDREALAIVKSIQEKDSRYPKPHVLEGHIYTNLGDYDNAELSLRKASKLGTKDPWLSLNWSTLRWYQGDLQAALSYAQEGLKRSGKNAKALVYAISTVSNLSSKLNRNAEINIHELIFKPFSDPHERLDIANRLRGQYSGRPELLNYAYQIVVKQKQETPDLAECDFGAASIVLTAGTLVVRNGIRRYSDPAMASATKLLTPHMDHEKIREGVVYSLFNIAMSDDNFKRAEELIAHAKEHAFKPTTIKNMQATFAFSQGKYRETIERINELVEIDPAWESSPLLAEAFDRQGDLSFLEEEHKRLVSRKPTDPWTLGNYAKFLLHRKGDLTGAVAYGEKAMGLMMYQSVIGSTALAYYALAAEQMRIDNKGKALDLYKKAQALNVSRGYIDKNCGKYCSDVTKLMGQLD